MAKKNEEIPTLRDAEEAWQDGDPETALAIAEGLMGEDEATAPIEVLFLAAECLLELQEPAEAGHLLDMALEREPDQGVLLHSRGIAWFELAELDKAQQAFTRASQLEPELAEARYYLGILAERRGDREAAQAAWTTAIELDPDGLAMPREWSEREIVEALADAVDEFPEPLQTWMRALPLLIEDLPSDERLFTDEGSVSPLVHSLFDGTRTTPQGDDPAGWLSARPDSATLYRFNLGKSALEPDELRNEILQALLWETIEFLGLEPEHIEALGISG